MANNDDDIAKKENDKAAEDNSPQDNPEESPEEDPIESQEDQE